MIVLSSLLLVATVITPLLYVTLALEARWQRRRLEVLMHYVCESVALLNVLGE